MIQPSMERRCSLLFPPCRGDSVCLCRLLISSHTRTLKILNVDSRVALVERVLILYCRGNYLEDELELFMRREFRSFVGLSRISARIVSFSSRVTCTEFRQASFTSQAIVNQFPS